MTWTVETAKARLGIVSSDTSQDAAIAAAMATAIAIAETYTSRKLLEQTDRIDTLYRHESRTVQLVLYPITAVTALDFDENVQDVAAYPVRAELGQILLPDQTTAETITVTYSGGYDPLLLPPDLEMALWSVFDSVWTSSTSGTTAGGIASIQVPDVGTIRFQGDSASGIYGAFEVLLIPYVLPRC